MHILYAKIVNYANLHIAGLKVPLWYTMLNDPISPDNHVPTALALALNLLLAYMQHNLTKIGNLGSHCNWLLNINYDIHRTSYCAWPGPGEEPCWS